MSNFVWLVIYSINIGVGATAFLDIWNLARHWLLDTPLTRYDMIGRWLLYMPEGQFVHDSIRKAAPRAGEAVVGWAGHYSIGVLFAFGLLGIWGLNWARRPKIIPAMIVGLATVAIPYFLMQPGMGSGIAGRLAPNPTAALIKPIVSHIVFGAGLYLSGWVLLLLGRQPK